MLPRTEREPLAVIAFNPDYLAALAEALVGTNRRSSEVYALTLYIYGPTEPIRVEGPLGYGVLMPIAID